MSNEVVVRYDPPGPVAAAFHRSNAFVRGIMGPVGSGKSVSCVWELFTRAAEQEPGSDGIRRTRWAIVRSTFPELKTTTIPTWLDWFSEEVFGPVVWGSPITHSIKYGDVEMEVWFIALDQPKHVKKLLSMELTGAWVNEAKETLKAIVDGLTQRVGRFPGKKYGCGITWSGVIMDTNPPDDDSWWYRLAEEDRPDGWEFFKQPGALFKVGAKYIKNPTAENIQNQQLGYNYYLRMLAGKTREWVKVYILGQYGTIIDGKPVYPEWNDSIHVAEADIPAMKGVPLELSWDFGLTPACIVSQITPRGQWRIIDELVSEDTGIRQFANDVVLPYLARKYPGIPIDEEGAGDPAGTKRMDTDERTVFDELDDAGLHAEPASTNNFIPRRESVAGYLTRLIDGKPAFLLSPRCKSLRKGFNGGYRYRRLQLAGEARYKDEPEKNEHSHPHDALQYQGLKLDTHRKNPIARKVKAAPPPPRPRKY